MTRSVPRRSPIEVRWRQFRNAPRPIVRAVVANVAVAAAGAAALLAYDIALSRGVAVPGGDGRPFAFAAFVVLVTIAGSVLTYLWVPLPTGSAARSARRRTAWSGMLGFFASVPICYLTLVVAFGVVRPLLG